MRARIFCRFSELLKRCIEQYCSILYSQAESLTKNVKEDESKRKLFKSKSVQPFEMTSQVNNFFFFLRFILFYFILFIQDNNNKIESCKTE